MEAASAAIELREVTRRYKDLVAVDCLTLSVDRGEILGLLGPNGSGKTTTVSMATGLLAPTLGAVEVLGHDMARNPRAVRRRIGSVPQETALYEELSAEANLRFHADLFDVPRAGLAERISALLELVGLEERRGSRAGTFSGGTKRRLALARALLHEPELLFLDEPTLGVDVHSRRALWEHIIGLKKRGKTVLLTTNYLEEASELCDRVAILDRGRLLVVDTPQHLRRRFGDTVLEIVTERHATPDMLNRLCAVPGVAGAVQPDGVLKVSVEGSEATAGQVVTLVVREAGLRRINQREPTLDEVFLNLTGLELRD